MGIKEIKEKMTENEKIELFDKWYDENYDEWAEGEEGIALREELEQAFKSGIATLEKENAELKSENQKWKDEWQEQVQKATDEGYARTLQTIQLSKAKDIIREFVEWATWQGNSKCPSFKDIQDKAEQFLNSEEK